MEITLFLRKKSVFQEMLNYDVCFVRIVMVYYLLPILRYQGRKMRNVPTMNYPLLIVRPIPQDLLNPI